MLDSGLRHKLHYCSTCKISYPAVKAAVNTECGCVLQPHVGGAILDYPEHLRLCLKV